MNNYKTAIVHEWLVNYAGSERCVESFTNIWPEADIFTLVDFLNEEQRKIILKGKPAKTSFIQKLPFARKRHRYYLPLFPTAIESFDVSKYEIVISSSHAVAKGVKTNKNQLHISYCYSPMRYAWESADEYLKGFKGSVAKLFINYLRKWDLRSAENPDYIIAISNYIKERIKRIYNIDVPVIYPPVDTHLFEIGSKEDFYLIASRMVPYKKMDLAVRAFNKMPDKKLIVIGDGPEMNKIKSIAGTNITLRGYQPFNVLKEHLMKAKAFIFTAEEDFGIIVVEAMACGTPVIAFQEGGASETVVHNKTGILFEHQNEGSLIEAVNQFESAANNFDCNSIRKHSEKFSRAVFEKNITEFVNQKAKEFFNRK
ncbi:MAG TPA: glycosyltransferase family 4 protein [Ignavibacteriaceae bacterium]|nr:glycosyltransferase family 4 protein [Ignavibacteriaceae bacterium]